ncbi:hypothetical protein LJ737_06920 [Hymenobacter sp. 15J16-1T3B]|uniref:hypothetical protein n=1 Tax=Hymenobacter sp. 15J16-1T3B TaxID=2886941 RepID=UPI001D12FAE5|nr:hypothetical protein [Hymenobacter sp. 15J16-1T3B]MCC3156962.1 hypothetical protein [Hymenobacter sp. 15J16-1T3B]
MLLRLLIWACLLPLGVACQSPESPVTGAALVVPPLLKMVRSPGLTVLPYDSAEYGSFLEGKATALSAQDLNQIEWLLQACIGEYNQAEEQRLQRLAPQESVDKSSLIWLQHYNRQAVPVTNKRGEKEVWVNCFCKGPRNWRTQLVRAKDGGKCYFSVRLNLATNQWTDLLINGEA